MKPIYLALLATTLLTACASAPKKIATLKRNRFLHTCSSENESLARTLPAQAKFKVQIVVDPYGESDRRTAVVTDFEGRDENGVLRDAWTQPVRAGAVSKDAKGTYGKDPASGTLVDAIDDFKIDLLGSHKSYITVNNPVTASKTTYWCVCK